MHKMAIVDNGQGTVIACDTAEDSGNFRFNAPRGENVCMSYSISMPSCHANNASSLIVYHFTSSCHMTPHASRAQT